MACVYKKRFNFGFHVVFVCLHKSWLCEENSISCGFLTKASLAQNFSQVFGELETLDYFLFVVWFVGFHPRKPLVKNDLCFIWCNQTNFDTEDASNIPVVWYLLSKITSLTDLKSSQCLRGLEPSNSRVMGTQEREGDISVACSWNVRIQLCGIGTPRIGAKSHYTWSASSGSQSDPV
jgi:hypothetical protein